MAKSKTTESPVKASELKLTKKLQEAINKTTKFVKDKADLELRKVQLEAMAKDNPLLKEYIDVLTQLADTNEQFKALKDGDLNKELANTELTFVECSNCLISFKRPYERIKFKQKEFLADYGPRSAMYKRYVEKTTVKGTVTILGLEQTREPVEE